MFPALCIPFAEAAKCHLSKEYSTDEKKIFPICRYIYDMIMCIHIYTCVYIFDNLMVTFLSWKLTYKACYAIHAHTHRRAHTHNFIIALDTHIGARE